MQLGNLCHCKQLCSI